MREEIGVRNRRVCAFVLYIRRNNNVLKYIILLEHAVIHLFLEHPNKAYNFVDL